MITNPQTGTRIDEVADGIYRIVTPLDVVDGGFSFNRYLVVDDEPLIFHTGLRSLAADTIGAIQAVMPIERLRHISFSHVEADECGAMNILLAAAPQAAPLCSRVAAMVSVNDLADRPPRALADGETMSTGRRTLRWIDAPHVPHGWEAGYLFDETSRTLFSGDLFTQGGSTHPAVSNADPLEPSEAFRLGGIDGGIYNSYSSSTGTRPIYEKMAALKPERLALMHGSTWQGTGDAGAALILSLADRLGATA